MVFRKTLKNFDLEIFGQSHSSSPYKVLMRGGGH